MGLSARSGAHARLMAERAVREMPELVYRPMERQMAELVAPASRNQDGSASARVYMETRSYFTDHRPSANVGRLVAGIHEALADPQPRIGEARARAMLLLSALEQVGIDAGSWQFAWESTLEPAPPPYASLGIRRPATNAGTAEAFAGSFSPLMEPRLRELHLSRMVYADLMLERRRRLAGRPYWKQPTNPTSSPSDAPTGKGPGAGGPGRPKGGKKGDQKGDQKGKDD